MVPTSKKLGEMLARQRERDPVANSDITVTNVKNSSMMMAPKSTVDALLTEFERKVLSQMPMTNLQAHSITVERFHDEPAGNKVFASLSTEPGALSSKSAAKSALKAATGAEGAAYATELDLEYELIDPDAIAQRRNTLAKAASLAQRR
jgi:hypothetical protein